MDDSSDLAEGAPVRLNGFAVGKVRKVGLSGSSERGGSSRSTWRSKTGICRRSRWTPSLRSPPAICWEPSISTSLRGKVRQTVKNGAEIRSEELTTIDNFVKQGNTALTALQKHRDQDGRHRRSGSDPAMETSANCCSTKRLYKKAQSLLDEANKLIVALNSNKGTIGKLMNDDTLLNSAAGLHCAPESPDGWTGTRRGNLG